MTHDGFKSLIVWQKAMDLAVAIYRATAHFPRSEQYGLTSQLRRAGYSPSSNISKGYGRRSPKDQDRFYEIADGSLAELGTFLILAQRIEYLSQGEYAILESQRRETARLLNGFRRRNPS